MKKILMIMAVALAVVACKNNEGGSDMGLDGSKEYTFSADVQTLFADGGAVAYDSRTVTTEEGAPEKFEAVISVPDLNVAQLDIAFAGIHFVEKMPLLPITMPAVPYVQVEKQGVNCWQVQAESIIPTIGGVPFPNYEMRSVEGEISLTTITLSFDITVSGVNYHVIYSNALPALAE